MDHVGCGYSTINTAVPAVAGQYVLTSALIVQSHDDRGVGALTGKKIYRTIMHDRHYVPAKFEVPTPHSFSVKM